MTSKSRSQPTSRLNLPLWRDVARVLGEVVGTLWKRRRPTPLAGPDGLRRLVQMKRRLQRQLGELEAELDRLQSTITGSPQSAPRADLDGWISRARQVRARTQEKRDELIRVERHIARERWLQSQSRRVPARPRRAERRARTRAEPRSAPLFERVLKKGAFPSRSQKLALQGLAERLRDSSAEVRHQACVELAEIDLPTARKLLLLALDDRNPRVQLAALNGLSGARGARAAGVFRRFLRHANPACRLAAIRGLAGTGSDAPSGVELRQALADDDAAVRGLAVKILARRGEAGASSARSVQVLAVALRDDDEEVRLAAVEALAAVGSDRAVAALIRAVGDEAASVREAAVSVLHNIVGPDIDPLLAEGSWLERATALKHWWTSARVELAVRESSRVNLGEAMPHAGSSSPPPYSRPVPRNGIPRQPARDSTPGVESPPPRGAMPPPASTEPDVGAESAARVAAPGDLDALAQAADLGGLESASPDEPPAESAASVAAPADLDALGVAAVGESGTDFESVLDDGGDAMLEGIGAAVGEGEGDFESVLGEPAEAEKSAEGTADAETSFESVFGGEEEGTAPSKAIEEGQPEGDEEAEAEEYESLFGSEE